MKALSSSLNKIKRKKRTSPTDLKKHQLADSAPERVMMIQVESFDDLPPADQKKVRESELSRRMCEENLELLLKVLHFVDKKNYMLDGEMVILPGDDTSYASEGFKEGVMGEIEVLADKKRFKKFNRIGKGGFASVYSSKDTVLDRTVSVKKLKNVRKTEKDNNLTEVGMLMNNQHEHIVQYLSSFQIKNEIWLVTELIDGLNLSDAVHIHMFDHLHVAYITEKVTLALEFLHERNIVHRDVKASNIMLGTNGDIKLVDFGLAADMSEGTRTQAVGTYWSLAPEIIKREAHDVKVDIWSLGMVVLQVFLGNVEKELKTMMLAATGGIRELFPTDLTEEQDKFLDRCLRVDPKKRFSAKKLLASKFLNHNTEKEDISDIIHRICVVKAMSLA